MVESFEYFDVVESFENFIMVNSFEHFDRVKSFEYFPAQITFRVSNSEFLIKSLYTCTLITLISVTSAI